MSTRPPPKDIVDWLGDIWARLWDVKISHGTIEATGTIETTIPHTVTVTATDLDIRTITETIPVSRTWSIEETIPIDIVSDKVGLLKPGQTINTQRLWSITETIPTQVKVLPFQGTPYRFYDTAAGTVISVATGQTVRIYGYYISALADEVVTLKYTDDKIVAVLPTKGVAAMNLLGINESNTVSVYLDKTGTGYALAVVYADILGA